MADKELGALSPIDALLAAALFHTVQQGNSRKVTAQQIADFVNGNYPAFIQTLLSAQDADDVYAAIGAAPDADKLGGQSPSFFASAEAVVDALADKVPTSRTVAGKPLTDNIALAKADVGLGNVDNTSDTNKPVSTAQQNALNQKVTGPSSALDNFPVAFDATTGKLIKAITGAIAALHALTPTADKLPYFSGGDAASLADLTAFARTILDDANGAAMFTTMGATSGTGWMKLPNGRLMQWGSSVSTTDSGGHVGVFFPTAFSAAGTYNVVAWNGESQTAGGNMVVSQLRSAPWPQSTGFAVACRLGSSGAALGSTGVRIDWIAIGIAP